MQFEYKVEVWDDRIYPESGLAFEETLNRFGAEGWELVSITPQISSNSSMFNGFECCDSVYVGCNVVVFKRPM